MFHVDANALLSCPIYASIEEVMHVHTLVVPRATPMPLLYQGTVQGQRPTQIATSPSSHPLIEVFLSILEFTRHKLLIVDSLILVPPSLRGWQAFPTPRALSPTAPQVSGVTLGSPLCPWCFRDSLWRDA